MEIDRRNGGYTLSQLLLAILIICMLLALLLPAIIASREAARRTQCNNNLKNISLGLMEDRPITVLFLFATISPRQVCDTRSLIVGVHALACLR